MLAPFFSYYGGKHRISARYPHPKCDTIIEPFAGSAGYACRYNANKVLLYDINPVIAGIWDYLINVSESEFLALPTDCEDLTTAAIPQEAKWLMGFWYKKGVPTPSMRKSGWAANISGYMRPDGTIRTMVTTADWITRGAKQLHAIRHWRAFNAPYTDATDVEADWFVDPPYNNSSGRAYTHRFTDYSALATWCMARRGQVIVCENEGADWLPFASIGPNRGVANNITRDEVIWVNDEKYMEAARLLAVLNAT